jgi:hypothetical protein
LDGHITAQGTGNLDEIAEVVWPIPPLIYPKAGVYDVGLINNGQELDTRSLFVRVTTGPQIQVK